MVETGFHTTSFVRFKGYLVVRAETTEIHEEIDKFTCGERTRVPWIVIDTGAGMTGGTCSS